MFTSKIRQRGKKCISFFRFIGYIEPIRKRNNCKSKGVSPFEDYKNGKLMTMLSFFKELQNRES